MTIFFLLILPEKPECFASFSTVVTESGENRKMSDLRVGDRVLAVDINGVYTFSPVILFLHRDPERSSQFYVIRTNTGHTLTLTASHLIFAMVYNDNYEDDDTFNDNIKYDEITSSAIYNYENNKVGFESFQAMYASNVREGDLVLIRNSSNNTGLSTARVVNVETRVLSGVYAPLTAQGNLVVDNVLVSCYALTSSHTMAHLAFAPLRMWYTLLDMVSFIIPSQQMESYKAASGINEFNSNGIHWYADGLHSIVQQIMPFVLFKG